MRKGLIVILCGATAALAACGGCAFAGIFGTPSRHERKVMAEYKLAQHNPGKIAVLVDQPPWLNAQVNLRYYLTDRINQALVRKAKVKPEQVISYDRVTQYSVQQGGISSLSPTAVGAALGARAVLLFAIEDYELMNIPETSYYKGFVTARSFLIDARTGEKLWPEGAQGKSVSVGFDVESKGHEAAAERLADAAAYCTVRYFYDCPLDKFKIGDDISEIGWKN